jgi:hypothetical protein
MKKLFFAVRLSILLIPFSPTVVSATTIDKKNVNLIKMEGHISPAINKEYIIQDANSLTKTQLDEILVADQPRGGKSPLQTVGDDSASSKDSEAFKHSKEILGKQLSGQVDLDFLASSLVQSTVINERTLHLTIDPPNNENPADNVKWNISDQPIKYNQALALLSPNQLSYLKPENSDSLKNKNSQIAQVSTSFADKQPLGWSQRDIAAPGSLADKLIGASTSKIPNISTPGVLATKLLTGFNSDGKFATGLSIDTVPYLLFRGSGMTLEEYRKDSFKRFLSNTSISIATNKETSSDVARVGISAQFTLINEGDRRMSREYLTKLEDFAATITQDPKLIGLPQDQINIEVGKRLAEFKKKEWYANEINRLAAKPIWTAGIGTSLITSTGRYSDLRGDGMGLWTTYRQGIGGDAQLILHGAYRSGERIADLNGGFFNGDTFVLGTRIRIGDETDSKYSLEAAYNIENKQGSTSNNYLSFGVGLEQKVLENLWLSLSFTVDPGRQSGADSRFNSGFKWEFGPAGI